MAELPSLCEHIHLPVQSGSDSVLKAMNRGYTYSDYYGKVERLRKKVPGIAITTDLIVGFPGETDEDHLCTHKGARRRSGLTAFLPLNIQREKVPGPVK